MIPFGMKFEDEVRRVAEAIWDLEPGACQPRHYTQDPVITELDGYAPLQDITHLLMVTMRRDLEKIKDDVKKLLAAERHEKNSGKPCSMWIVTKEQLDAQHITYARKSNIKVITFKDFSSRFFNFRDYISKRRVAPFGSARNLADNSVTFPDDIYVTLPFEIRHGKSVGRDNPADERFRATSIFDVLGYLNAGQIVVMLAPFGAGKSLTTRELFLQFAKKLNDDPEKWRHVPIVLNLREHWAQPYFDEILERHARSIGFMPPQTLTRAWRAGLVSIYLDGFDELAAQSVGRRDDKNFMRDARAVALAGVRDFLTKRPAGMGILITGRDHYFDSEQEMIHAFGLSGQDYKIVKLGEFTEEQAEIFMRKHGSSLTLPAWLPRKPLILGYLAQKNLLKAVLEIDGTKGFGYAWDAFIDLICAREAQLERAVMDPATLRAVMEQLATYVRGSVTGAGPITGNDLSNAYSGVTGQPPVEGVLAQLQRLPGLTEREQELGARSFVDQDMLAALQGSAFAESVLQGIHDDLLVANWIDGLSEQALSMAAFILEKKGAEYSAPFAIATSVGSRKGKPLQNKQLIADCLAVAGTMADSAGIPQIDCRGLVVENCILMHLNYENVKLTSVEFRNCTVQELTISVDIGECQVRFTNCDIDKVNGVSSRGGLPADLMDEATTVTDYDDISTNSAVLRLPYPPAVKALITILKKVYKQAGAGRKIAALSRGLPAGPIADRVPEVLKILESEGLVSRYNNVVHPVRKNGDRVEHILNAASASTDPAMEKAKKL